MKSSISKFSKSIHKDKKGVEPSQKLIQAASYKLGSSDGMWSAVKAAITSVKYHQRKGVSRPAIIKFLSNVKQQSLDTRTRGMLSKVLHEKVLEGTLTQSGQSFKFKNAEEAKFATTVKKPASAATKKKQTQSNKKNLAGKNVAGKTVTKQSTGKDKMTKVSANSRMPGKKIAKTIPTTNKTKPGSSTTTKSMKPRAEKVKKAETESNTKTNNKPATTIKISSNQITVKQEKKPSITIQNRIKSKPQTNGGKTAKPNTAVKKATSATPKNNKKKNEIKISMEQKKKK